MPTRRQLVKHIESVKFPLPGYPHFPITAPYELEMKKTIEKAKTGEYQKKKKCIKVERREEQRRVIRRADSRGQT